MSDSPRSSANLLVGVTRKFTWPNPIAGEPNTETWAAGWPKHDAPALLESMSLEQALTREFRYPAFLVQYAPTKYRLGKELWTTPGALAKVGNSAVMEITAFDADAPGHGKRSHEQSVLVEEWWSEEILKVERLLLDIPGLYVYRSVGGYRIVGILPKSWGISSEQGCKDWTRKYHAWANFLNRVYQIKVDHLGDWGRLQRVPHDSRDFANPTRLECIGDPRDVGVWDPELHNEDWPEIVTVKENRQVTEGDPLLMQLVRTRGLLQEQTDDPHEWRMTCPRVDLHSPQGGLKDYPGKTHLYTNQGKIGAIWCQSDGCKQAHATPQSWLDEFSKEEKQAAKKALGWSTLQEPERVTYEKLRADLPQSVVSILQDGLDEGKPQKTIQSCIHQCVCQMVRKGYTPEQVLGVLTDAKEAPGISAHVNRQEDPEWYVEKALERARESITAEAANPTALTTKPPATVDLKTVELIGATDKLKKAVAQWRAGGELKEEKAFVKWIFEMFPDKATNIVGQQLGEKYMALLPKSKPKDAADTLDGNNFYELIDRACEKLPKTKSNQSELYVWENGKYRRVEKSDYQVMVRKALSEFTIVSGSDNPTYGLLKRHVNEITQSILEENDAEMSSDELVLFRNGYLKDGVLHPSNPDIFQVGGPDCNYTPGAKCPLWLKFLSEQWAKDSSSIALLQEIMGLLLVDDISFQSCFVMIGPPRSGKGTIMRVIKKLTGPEYSASFTVMLFSKNFGLQNFVGKTNAIAGDVRGPFHPNTRALAKESILSITGGDDQYIDRKFLGARSLALRVRLFLNFNDIDDVRELLLDTKGATAARLRALCTTISFAGREDMKLDEKLYTELAGIANWALEGLQRLRKQGFTMNEATQKLRESTKLSNVKEFLNDMMRDDKVLSFAKPISGPYVYGLYKKWCEGQGIKPKSARGFATQVTDAVPHVLFTDHARHCAYREESYKCPNRARFFVPVGGLETIDCYCIEHYSSPTEEEERQASREEAPASNEAPNF